MNENKNMLDEFQEQKLLAIERNGFWLAFWGLLLAILVQVIVGFGKEWLLRSMLGEWILLMCLCVYMVAACIKNGIWSRCLKPGRKTNVRAGFIAATICGFAISLAVYIGFKKLVAALISGGIAFALTFAITFVLLTALEKAYRKKVDLLESEEEADSEGDNL